MNCDINKFRPGHWWLLVSLASFVCSPTDVSAKPDAVLDIAPIQTGKFRSPLLKRSLSFRVFAPDKSGGSPMPLIVYAKNLAIPRLGTVSDSDLILSFLQDGFLVVEVDYQNNSRAKGGDMYVDVLYLYRIFGANKGINPDKPSFNPLMDEFIKWDDERIETYQTFTTEKGGTEIQYKIDPLWVYVIPESYTIERDIEVSTIQTDKRSITHRMDIIHPASPAKSVPSVLEISTTIQSEDPAQSTRINRNSCYVFTWAMSGYAAIILDNVANGITSVSIYGKQMTAPTGPHFPEKRALRLLRARKSDWGLTDKVAVMGISKSAMRAIVAALINDETPNDKYVMEADKGPHSDQSDRFDAMVAGGFPWPRDKWPTLLDHLSADDPVLVWCQSVYLSRMTRRDYVDQVREKEIFLREVIGKRSDAFGIPYQIFFGTPIGHDFDYIYLRHTISFLDQYMK